MNSPLILAVDRAWTPLKWLDRKAAMNLISRGLLDYSVGETALVLRGGINAATGRQSILEIGSIFVVNTRGYREDYNWSPAVNNDMLFQRDRQICAYCGGHFPTRKLSADHVQPKSRGGKDIWTNLVSSCLDCNQRKGNRYPHEAKMSLLYVPYAPNRCEALILSNRRILADQMEFLTRNLPKHSRLLS